MPIYKTLEDLCEDCDNILRRTGSLFSLYVNILTQQLSKLTINYTNLASFSDDTYKRNLIYTSDVTEVYLICWKAGQKSKIHDHSIRGCVMIILEGEIIENKYKNIDNNLKLSSSDHLTVGAIGYNFGSHTVHEIIPVNETISLHIYPKNYTPRYYLL